ncbi:MAG TPA: adenylyltransferase/cytidyltransferase family protein [Phenylobacterium sp.]|uniref:adenylyltransferase/cytidyltransferase family protein n=1 Tax=Phenylobacterium sp. TaxID=1871053 RepID=UPI002BE43EE2|nr:adenylyltransferase/cytidyltransferase family protein [Phenylobacterium sp.]HSV03163.1 adenylyltransferase/cytidyltransferase family protein [Phenylobacterium sp.]
MSYTPHNYAPVLTLEEFRRVRDERSSELGTVVATSGGFDPIHPGHVTCIVESKALGDTLVVIVNGDEFLRNKKGKAFQDIGTRCAIVSAIRGVDFVVKFEISGDPTVTEALRAIRPRYFTKGGDRVAGRSLPPSEEAVCREFDIQIVDGVGREKAWSSSDFLAEWGEFWRSRAAAELTSVAAE